MIVTPYLIMNIESQVFFANPKRARGVARSYHSRAPLPPRIVFGTFHVCRAMFQTASRQSLRNSVTLRSRSRYVFRDSWARVCAHCHTVRGMVPGDEVRKAVLLIVNICRGVRRKPWPGFADCHSGGACQGCRGANQCVRRVRRAMAPKAAQCSTEFSFNDSCVIFGCTWARGLLALATRAS